MTITSEKNNNTLTLSLDGRLDTNTAPQLETAIAAMDGDVTSLVLDFSALSYISSAGLRVLLSAHKIMGARGGMRIHNVCESVMDVFEITGFSDILTIE